MMKSKERRLPLPPTDIVTVAVATLAFVFILAFGGKALESHRLQRHNAMLRAEIAALEQEREELEQRLQYVESPEYVERVAREEYRWTRPGENLVIPIYRRRSLPAATPTPAPSSNEAVVTPSASYWSEWWELLTGPFD